MGHLRERESRVAGRLRSEVAKLRMRWWRPPRPGTRSSRWRAHRLPGSRRGPRRLRLVGPWVTHIEYRWEHPQYASYLRRIASFARLILFDKRAWACPTPFPP